MNFIERKKDIEIYLHQFTNSLISEIELLLKNEKHQIINNFNDLKAVQFDFDWDYSVVAYSAIFEDLTSIIRYKLDSIYFRCEEIFPNESFTELEENMIQKLIRFTFLDWFSECWKNAKQFNNKIRGFIYEHDNYTGIDLDTRMPVDVSTYDDVSDILRVEGLL